MKPVAQALFALGLAGASPGVALAQEAMPEPLPEQAMIALTEADVQKFSEIYVDLETARTQLVEELSASGDDTDIEHAKLRLQEQLVATIEEHGWSVDRYNNVAAAINNDPVMRERAIEIISGMVGG